MPRTASLTKTARREIQDLLLTRLSVEKIAEITDNTKTCVQMIADRWYDSNGCRTRVELMAQEILRLREVISGIQVN